MRRAIAVIVGLHFLPMARPFPFVIYYALGIVLCGPGLPGFPVGGRSGMQLTGRIASATVTGGAVLPVLRGRRARTAA